MFTPHNPALVNSLPAPLLSKTVHPAVLDSWPQIARPNSFTIAIQPESFDVKSLLHTLTCPGDTSQAWVAARQASDFAKFVPVLQEWVDLTRERSKCIDPANPAYDVALQDYEKGMTTARLDQVFSEVAPSPPPPHLTASTVLLHVNSDDELFSHDHRHHHFKFYTPPPFPHGYALKCNGYTFNPGLAGKLSFCFYFRMLFTLHNAVRRSEKPDACGNPRH